MHLKELFLYNFKNYEEVEITFSKHINIFLGDNGAGKTNILDAIHYLCLTKSAFTNSDSYAVRKNEAYFSNIGVFDKDDDSFKIICGLKLDDKKVLSVNGKSYTKLSEHIGRFPCVLIAPDHIAIIKEGSDERRKFIDNVISQIDTDYLEQLLVYNKYLKARNMLLKQFYEQSYRDMDLLETYTLPLIKAGTVIHKKRQEFIGRFTPLVERTYNLLATSKEAVRLHYESELNITEFELLNNASLKDDFKAHRTTKGIHQDEFVFNVNDLSLRKFGSQGQQKTFLLALKIAQHQIITEVLAVKPLMLLDDIFDKLDDSRIAQLLQMCKSDYFGQVFITDARRDRTLQLFAEQNIKADAFVISKNSVQKLN